MTIDIFCPLYNAQDYILSLHQSLLKQKKVKINKIMYLLTESDDNSLQILKENKLNYVIIKKAEFSHSLTREKYALKSKADIIVFISQDVVIESDRWLYYLTVNINDECAGAYSRQVSKFNNIERYTRESNYPSKSFMVSEKDLSRLGLKTFFFSDASSAIKTSVFKELNGYDGKDLPINEDMYFAYKLITNGYKIYYASKSVVYHSHNFTLRQLYNRYKLTGKFFKENAYLDNYGTTKTGGGLAKYILKRALKDKNIKVLIRYPFDMAVRLIGMKVGKL